ncbi:hypothetical protein [Pedobacter nutrimenti]|uniref:hypothetical protein n=1 Tax=Pedobacter nutrimenti TaxID=1241337 RepID=UPI00292E5378|nr:hypothetical protein [Pedobacter nutrimenti]
MIYIALLLAGILLLIISVNSLKAKIAFVKNSERVERRVSELKENIQDGDTLYPPGKPEEARPMTYFGLFNWIILLMGLGMALTITGLGYFLLRGYLNT